MQETNGSGGLCLTCNNVPGCYYRATRGPALFCELFDDYVPPVERTTSERRSPPARAPMARRTVEEEIAKHTGLCMNCEHRRVCTHPKPEGGVWHCENYV